MKTTLYCTSNFACQTDSQRRQSDATQ